MATVQDRGVALFDGERDYNHATDNTYKDLRAQAEKLYSKRSQLSSQSQQAYQRGDKQRAKELSDELKRVLNEAENYNKQAAEYVFRENNADSAEDEIDLHGLYVKEAEWILKRRISECLRTNQSHLKVIVGKGLHSQNGIAKLKPAVDQLCDESGLKHYIDNKNSGVLVIDFTNSSGNQIPSHWEQPSYGNNMQPQYQQQHGSNQQYGNNNQNINTGNLLVDTLIKIVCSCLKWGIVTSWNYPTWISTTIHTLYSYNVLL